MPQTYGDHVQRDEEEVGDQDDELGDQVQRARVAAGQILVVAAAEHVIGEGNKDTGGEHGVGGQPTGDLQEVAQGVERRHVCEV